MTGAHAVLLTASLRARVCVCSGVLEWTGQMLLKGPNDAAPIKLVADKSAAPAEPAKAEEPKAEAATDVSDAAAESKEVEVS